PTLCEGTPDGVNLESQKFSAKQHRHLRRGARSTKNVQHQVTRVAPSEDVISCKTFWKQGGMLEGIRFLCSVVHPDRITPDRSTIAPLTNRPTIQPTPFSICPTSAATIYSTSPFVLLVTNEIDGPGFSTTENKHILQGWS